MRTFEELTRGGQVRRMHRLAEAALQAYDLEPMQLTPLTHFFNTTFRLDAAAQVHQESPPMQKQKRAKERYVLRIHRAGSQDRAVIVSELRWLHALRHEAGLIVPEPIITRNGELLTCVATEGVPHPRFCVLFRWVEGRFLRSRLGVQELARVGRFMAYLHRHAEQFYVPDGFIRPTWSYEGIHHAALGTDLEQSWAHLSSEDRTTLEAVGEQVQCTMQSLGQTREVFGLIHADLYERNYLFCGKSVHAIDFDGCGWGYYLFDIGVTFSTLLARPDYPALRSAFLAGYRQVRPLSQAHERLIDTFVAARLMGHLL